MFRDLSDRVRPLPPAAHAGVAVLDADGDGRWEFVVAAADGPNRVLKWAGGQLRDVTPPGLAGPDRPAAALAAADVDGDGAEELYVATAAGPPDRLLKRAVDGHWDDLFERPGSRRARAGCGGDAVAVLDRRGTGRFGFAVAAAGRPLRLLEVGPAGTLVDLAPSLGLDAAAGARGLLPAPLLSPRTDLFCLSGGGPNRLYRNRGGSFDEVAGCLGLTDEAEAGHAAAAVDLDGDGRLDVAWGNADGPHRLMVRPPGGPWRDHAPPAVALPSTVRAVIAADFDNDGHDELFLVNAGEPNRLFRVAAGPGRPAGEGSTVTLLDAGEAASAAGVGAAVADVDGDGVLELLVTRGDGGPPALYKARAADAGGNAWLRVAPRTRFGAPARGATVRLVVDGRPRVRAVDGGCGVGQSEPVAHFGLGRGVRVGPLLVVWPDGAAVTIPSPGVNRVLAVPYPGG